MTRRLRLTDILDSSAYILLHSIGKILKIIGKATQTITMDALFAQVRDLYAGSSEIERQTIQEQLRTLQSSFDDDWDLVVRLASGAIIFPLVKIGTSLSVFATLCSSQTPVLLSSLSATTGADPKTLSRLLRAMAAFGLIEHDSSESFSANRTTFVLANEHVSGALAHCYDIHIPAAYALPAWLSENEYRDIATVKDLPFHKALGTEMTPFEWMKAHPEHMTSLGHAMAIQRKSSWIESFPVINEIGKIEADPNSILLVDIGGGFGQQALSFRKKFSSVPGRIIVQDIPATLASAPKLVGVEFQIHDFFTEQPNKRARFYYLRHILHDWTDQESIEILKNIVPAMGSESRIIIDEIVLPDEKLPWQAAYSESKILSR